MDTNGVTVIKGEGWSNYIDHFPHDQIMPIGTIKVGLQTEGALGLDATDGCYYLYRSAGEPVELNQRKVQAAIEALSRVGKPRKGYEVRELYTIRLEPSIAEYLRNQGGGNLAEGITRLAQSYRGVLKPERVRFADGAAQMIRNGDLEFGMIIDGAPRIYVLSDEAQRTHFDVVSRQEGERRRAFIANKKPILEAVKDLLERDPGADTLGSADLNRT
jgi:hypothetical protein